MGMDVKKPNTILLVDYIKNDFWVLFLLISIKNETMLNRLTTNTKSKFPYANRYIKHMQDKQATEEGIRYEIDLLNKAAECPEPASFGEKFTTAFIVTMLNPTGPILGTATYYNYDNCDPRCREVQQRYNEFVAKL